jgi:hypothetical protein
MGIIMRSPISFSDDLLIYGVVLFNDFPMPFPAGQIPSAFNGQVRDFQLRIGEEMDFANPAFFCKYFKRLTGMTPNGFRG